MFENVSILGTGLIGASFGLALKAKGLCSHVTGYGRSEANLKVAKDMGAIDAYSTDAVEACRDADLVMLSTPVEQFVPLMQKVGSTLKQGAYVIDAGSVKGTVIYELQGVMPAGLNFVGCHPIAGSEKSGAASAEAGLFELALCVITPTQGSDVMAVMKAQALWQSIGCRTTIMSPEKHDRIYGLVSHFPHLAAFAAVNVAESMEKNSMEFGGNGFKDFTRIALSHPGLWRNICLQNSSNIVETIDRYIDQLNEIKSCLEKHDGDALEKIFTRAQVLRGEIGN